MKVIDLRKPELNELESGDRVITSKGFEFEFVAKDTWKDLRSGLTWLPVEDGRYSHYEAVEKFKDRLPTIEEFKEAESHGFRELTPKMTDHWFWSASLGPSNSDDARVFNGFNGYSYYVFNRGYYVSVRCVGR